MAGKSMPCLLLLLFLAFPRVVLVVLALMTQYLQRAYHGMMLVPVIGFILAPLTTLVYAWMINNHQSPTTNVNLIILIIAVVIDLGGLSGGEWHRRSRYR